MRPQRNVVALAGAFGAPDFHVDEKEEQEDDGKDIRAGSGGGARLLGIGGLLLGDGLLGGLLNIDVGEDIVHILTGGILAYVGFAQRYENVARSVVGVLGVVYLLVGLLGFVVPFLFGLIPSGYTIADNLVHLALGALGIAVGYLSGGEDRSTARRT